MRLDGYLGTNCPYEEIFPQLVEELFSIPWGHHRYIIDKCKNVDEALFFVNEVHKNNWSRDY